MKEVISIDLGATNLRVGLVKEDLSTPKVLRERTTKNDKELLYSQIKRMMTELLTSEVYKTSKPKVIGVSACGIVNNNHIECLPNLGITDFDLKERLEKDFKNFKVYISNDANTTAFAEATYGMAKEFDTSFFITISSGIGGCLVYNHELIDLPFEIGHLPIRYKEKFYESEKLLSGNGIVELAKLNGLDVESASMLFSLVQDKDTLALKVYDEWIKYLGSLISSLHLMFGVDVFILSGGVMKSSDIFMDDLKEVSSAFTIPYLKKPIIFKHSKFDQDAGLMGGASIALKTLNRV